jgi:molybdopterin-synthase adenylyltransferase
MIGKFYVYNALRLSVNFMETGKNPHCPLCGEDPVITELMDGESDSCEIG